MSTDATQIVSRQAEERALIDFLDSIPQRPGALIIEGDPGIGKTTLWLDATERARQRDFQVLPAARHWPNRCWPTARWPTC